MLMRYVFIAAACVLLGPAVIGHAADQGQSASPKDEKKVCRNVVPTGSIMPKRYCLTRSEWARINEINDKKSAERFRNKGSIGCGKGDGPNSCDPGLSGI